jgi:hypothetical protein
MADAMGWAAFFLATAAAALPALGLLAWLSARNHFQGLGASRGGR